MVRTLATSLLIDKGNHRHFMAKEIYEQPEVVGHTLAHYLDFAAGRSALPANPAIDFAGLDRLSITACGTAYYAGLVAKYWFERFARLPVDIDIASEFRYREQPLAQGGLSIVVSQSGETADTLASLRYAKSQGQTVAAVVNVREFDHRARIRRGAADACRTRDRRRLDQGFHLPARGARLAGARGGQGARVTSRRKTRRSWSGR